MKTEETDTKKKIIEASTKLFATKGFAGSSTREIAKLAGVNLASLNYHFKSKHNLLQEVAVLVVDEFKGKLKMVGAIEGLKAADYAVKVFEVLTDDGAKSLNQFKLFLDAENFAGELDPFPLGFEELSGFLKNELHDSVPHSARLWANSIVFNYVLHMAVISQSPIGRKHVEKYLPNKRDTIPTYIRQLVDTLIRDLNNQHPAH